jgi:hypothetical protein
MVGSSGESSQPVCARRVARIRLVKPLANDPNYAALFAEIRERQHGGYPRTPSMVRVTLRVPD